MMMQALQEIHHKSGQLLQMMSEMGQREDMPYRNNMGFRDNNGGGQYRDNNGGGVNQRMPYIDPMMY